MRKNRHLTGERYSKELSAFYDLIIQDMRKKDEEYYNSSFVSLFRSTFFRLLPVLIVMC